MSRKYSSVKQRFAVLLVASAALLFVSVVEMMVKLAAPRIRQMLGFRM